jgi:hypothetical protein
VSDDIPLIDPPVLSLQLADRRTLTWQEFGHPGGWPALSWRIVTPMRDSTTSPMDIMDLCILTRGAELSIRSLPTLAPEPPRRHRSVELSDRQ